MAFDPDMNEDLLRIRKRFVAKLKEWLPVFEEFTSRLGDGLPENFEDVRMQAHKFAGSALTFGFPKLSADASRVETYLDAMATGDQKEDITDTLRAVLADFVSGLRSVVSEASTTPTAEISGHDTARFSGSNEAEHSDSEFHILVADDDELVRDLLNFGLEKENCNLIQAHDGLAVTDYLEKSKRDPRYKRPDLLILDVNMPNKNGFAVMRELRSDAELNTIPIVMLTRKGEDESIIEGISLGAIDYITKPFDASELVSRIVGILKRQKAKLLIADDDDLIRELLQHHFRRTGFTVLLADNGNDALAMIQKEKPNLVIMDIMMPGIDGLAVLRHAKSIKETANIPIIVLTAKGQQKNILLGLESGAHDYVTKPFDIEELSARVSAILRRRNAA